MKDNLIEISSETFDVELDLRYASSNNVCKIKLYKNNVCYLHKDAAEAFKKAIKIASEQNLRFKIFDGFRPISVQRIMYNKFPEEKNNKISFISNPDSGSIPHCRGVAVDLTLIDKNNNELDMGSDFDEFSEISYHNCTSISKQAIGNRKILLEIMTKAGWDFYSKEWWHYQLFNPRSYPVIDYDI